MRQYLFCILIFTGVLWIRPVLQAAPQAYEFSGLVRRFLVSLTPKDVNFLFDGATNGSRPNYNWSLAYGPTPVCTFAEVQKIRDTMGPANFANYGEYINFGWLYEQQDFEFTLRKFLMILKKDKSGDARVLQAVVENALSPENVSQQKSLIAFEIEKNEKRLAAKAGITREKAKALAMDFSRKFNSCLGRYQTGYINLTLHLR
jgi:hypothetical protein